MKLFFVEKGKSALAFFKEESFLGSSNTKILACQFFFFSNLFEVQNGHVRCTAKVDIRLYLIVVTVFDGGVLDFCTSKSKCFASSNRRLLRNARDLGSIPTIGSAFFFFSLSCVSHRYCQRELAFLQCTFDNVCHRRCRKLRFETAAIGALSKQVIRRWISQTIKPWEVVSLLYS